LNRPKSAHGYPDQADFLLRYGEKSLIFGQYLDIAPLKTLI